MDNVYPNWRCNAYHVYGDKSNKDWSYQELKKYFEINGTDCAVCIKQFVGEFFTFNVSDFVQVNVTADGYFSIRKY